MVCVVTSVTTGYKMWGKRDSNPRHKPCHVLVYPICFPLPGRDYFAFAGAFFADAAFADAAFAFSRIASVVVTI